MTPAAPHTDAEIRAVNERYHDVAAASYDAKWGISFDATGERQVTMKLRKALGREPGRYEHALEIGSGTGYFSLNLVLAGVIGRATCTDISPGMLRALAGNAARLGLEVETVAADAAALPFADGTFDLVFGHAVLHHLPDLPAAFREFHRVLAPGGTAAFAGEPSRHGDRLAAAPKLLGRLAAPAWRLAVGARAARAPVQCDADHDLEQYVDIHAFRPSDLAEVAREAGFADVRVRGEELVANLFGWANRALEATAEPDDVPTLWRRYAYHGYLALQRLDTGVLEPRLPPELFYNLMVSARRPG